MKGRSAQTRGRVPSTESLLLRWSTDHALLVLIPDASAEPACASRMRRATTRTTCWSDYKGTRCRLQFRGPPITEADRHASRRGHAVVQAPMAQTTKGDQVFFRVVPKQAPRPDVVNFEILQRPASLAAPAVAVQDCLTECGVWFRAEKQPGSSLPN